MYGTKLRIACIPYWKSSNVYYTCRAQIFESIISEMPNSPDSAAYLENSSIRMSSEVLVELLLDISVPRMNPLPGQERTSCLQTTPLLVLVERAHRHHRVGAYSV